MTKEKNSWVRVLESNQQNSISYLTKSNLIIKISCSNSLFNFSDDFG